MKLTSRCAARIGSLLAQLAAAFAAASLPANAATPPYVFGGARIVFETLLPRGASTAIAADDPGLQQLLADVGATLTWQDGRRTVLFTTGEPAVVAFTVGRRTYDVGPSQLAAPFAPFLLNGRVYVPLNAVLEGLELAPKASGNVVVLQPQLASIVLQEADGGEKLVARGGMPLQAALLSDNDGRIVVAFDGVGTTLPATQPGRGPVREIDVATDGTAANPRTIVTLLLTPGTTHTALGTDDQRDVAIGFDGADVPQQLAAASPAASPAEAPAPGASPSAPASPGISPTPGLAQVTGVETQALATGFTVRISVSGNAQYEWHRLRPPDNRFWIDVEGARLAAAPLDEPETGIVTGVRSHQEDPVTVRVALSLADFQNVTVTPDAQGVTIAVDQGIADVNSAPRTGQGSVGAEAAPQSAPEPVDWSKFAPRTKYVARNPRLIVIDPGHGGSDAGSVHDGVVEKTINLEIAKRLRDILVARGWQVMMTRSSDREVYGPDPTDDEELGARDEVANGNGARLFVSIHGNAFMNAGPHGATVYYYKSSDLSLAQDIARSIGSEGVIASDGVVKDKLYVVHHANMPAALVETAYLTNPDDRRLLVSPQWQERIAKAIADGITQYAGDPPPALQSKGP